MKCNDHNNFKIYSTSRYSYLRIYNCIIKMSNADIIECTVNFFKEKVSPHVDIYITVDTVNIFNNLVPRIVLFVKEKFITDLNTEILMSWLSGYLHDNNINPKGVKLEINNFDTPRISYTLPYTVIKRVSTKDHGYMIASTTNYQDKYHS